MYHHEESNDADQLLKHLLAKYPAYKVDTILQVARVLLMLSNEKSAGGGGRFISLRQKLEAELAVMIQFFIDEGIDIDRIQDKTI